MQTADSGAAALLHDHGTDKSVRDADQERCRKKAHRNVTPTEEGAAHRINVAG